MITTMRLTRRFFDVHRIDFGSRTAWDAGRLTIDRDGLIEVLADDLFGEVDVATVEPGESARIVHVLDALPVMRKVTGPGSVFPGFAGPPSTAGSGETNVLDGVAIVVSSEFPEPTTGVLARREGFIDMSGPAAPMAACSETHNVVFVFRPKAGTTNGRYDEAMRRAAIRASEYLAAAVAEAAPSRVVSYALSEASGLPRIGYITQLRQQGPLVQNFLYGLPIDNLVPTLVHPNELMDGALVSANYAFKVPTYYRCHDPVVFALYECDGQDLAFGGIILMRGHNPSQFEKERTAAWAAKLATIAGWDGAIFTIEGSGNGKVEFLRAAELCEQAGIRTVLIDHEFGGPRGTEDVFIHAGTGVDAFVSTGSADHLITAPPVHRAIGGDEIECYYAGYRGPATSALQVSAMDLYACAWKMGMSGVSAVYR